MCLDGNGTSRGVRCACVADTTILAQFVKTIKQTASQVCVAVGVLLFTVPVALQGLAGFGQTITLHLRVSRIPENSFTLYPLFSFLLPAPYCSRFAKKKVGNVGVDMTSRIQGKNQRDVLNVVLPPS